jgi:hypothetical protein
MYTLNFNKKNNIGFVFEDEKKAVERGRRR